MTFTLILTSLILLSTERVSVHVEQTKVEHLSQADCEYWAKVWRADGPQHQAACKMEQ